MAIALAAGACGGMSEQRMRVSDRVKKSVWLAAAAGVACMAGVAQATTTDPGQKELTQAVKKFLVDHGDLCMAKYTWPRDVTPGDESTDRNDVAQLPVLEHLGVVKSVEVPAPPKTTAAGDAQAGAPQSSQAAPAEPTRRYSLTEKGQQYYLKKKHTIIGPHDLPTEHDADFCVAHLTLDKVVKWSPPEPVHDRLQTVVRYTYHVKAADWMSDPDAQKVFPIVDRIIRGDGSRMMSATVALQDGKWVPVLPVR
jgi:hypothetical protein